MSDAFLAAVGHDAAEAMREVRSGLVGGTYASHFAATGICRDGWHTRTESVLHRCMTCDGPPAPCERCRGRGCSACRGGGRIPFACY
jgi:hypothetical protein